MQGNGFSCPAPDRPDRVLKRGIEQARFQQIERSSLSLTDGPNPNALHPTLF
jgi:hypothetical protein